MCQGAVMVYKCRKCEGLDKSTHVPDGLTVAIAMTTDTEIPRQWVGHKPTMVSIHYCDDGNIGVTDAVK